MEGKGTRLLEVKRPTVRREETSTSTSLLHEHSAAIATVVASNGDGDPPPLSPLLVLDLLIVDVPGRNGEISHPAGL